MHTAWAPKEAWKIKLEKPLNTLRRQMNNETLVVEPLQVVYELSLKNKRNMFQ